MISIDDADALRQWLTRRLKQLCEADPVALTNYVFALIKKDKPEIDLRSECNEQLDAFLKSATVPFVEELFSALESKSYINTTESPQRIIIQETTNERERVKEVSKNHKRIRSRSPRNREVRHRSPTEVRRRAPEEQHRARRRSPDNRRYYGHKRAHQSSPSSRNRRGRSSVSPHRRIYRNSPPPRKSRSPLRNRSRSMSHEEPVRRRSSPTKRSVGDSNGKKLTQCYDYNEKGYCFKGELCPYDHGSDAIAVEDVDLSTGADENDDGVAKNEAENKASIVKLIQPAIQVQQPAAMSLHQSIISIPPPLLPRHPPMSMPPQHIMRNFPPPMNVNIPPPRILPPQSLVPPPYNPELPSLRNDNRSSKVITSQVMVQDGNLRKRFVNDTIGGGHINSEGQPPFKKSHMGNFRTKRILLIVNIPQMHNNITKLNEHFSRFGAINNIQVKYDNLPNQALIEFAHNNSAKAAHSDSSAVLSNRFIKVFWFDPSKSATPYVSTMDSGKKPSVKDRLGVTPGKLTDQTTFDSKKGGEVSLTRTIENSETSKTKEPKVLTIEEMQKKEEDLKKQNQARLQILAARKLSQQKKQKESNEVQLKKVELQIQSQGLLAKQVEQKRKLMERLTQNPNMPANERSVIKETLNQLSKSMNTIRQINMWDNATSHKSREQQEKQKQQQAGGGGYRQSVYGARSTRGGARAVNNSLRFYKSGANLDRRPSQLRVSGFEEDERDEMISHFSEFGEIDDITFDEENLSCFLKYKTRSDAEQAASVGVSFKKKSLAVVWANPIKKASPAVVPSLSSMNVASTVGLTPTATVVTASATPPTNILTNHYPGASSGISPERFDLPPPPTAAQQQHQLSPVTLVNANKNNGLVGAVSESAIGVSAGLGDLTTTLVKSKTTVLCEDDSDDDINVEINNEVYPPSGGELDEELYELYDEDELDEDELLTGADDASWQQ